MKEYAVKNGGEYIVTEDDEISKFNEEQAESLCSLLKTCGGDSEVVPYPEDA